MARMSVEQVAKCMSAVKNAKNTLKAGDRISSTRCGGYKTTYIFECWDGDWIVSKSGIDDISANNIYRLNGKPVDFTTPQVVTLEDAKLAIQSASQKRIEFEQSKIDGPVPF